MMELRWGAKEKGRAVLLAGAAWLALAASAQAQQPLATIPAAPAPSSGRRRRLGDTGYYLESDLLIRDDANQKMIARGDVEARYQGRTLRADEVVYDTKTEVVTAHGHVTLINADGTAEFANDMTMDKDLKAGFARGFSARLDKNIKIAADSAVRRNEKITELNKAIYTPCEVCAEKPKPTWSIQADKVVQDKNKHLVYYHGATIRVWGAPLMYLPVFWHPDPQTERRSGFLVPKIGVSKKRGLVYEQPYLFVLSPSQDVVVTPQFNTKVNPFLKAQYRKRFYSGYVEARVGATYDKDFDNHGDRFGEATAKSYILAKGLFDIDENWKWGFTAERASQALIFDDYDISDVYQQRGQFSADDHRLMSQIYATRQSDRSYLSASMISVQGLRVVQVSSAGLANQFENSGAFPADRPPGRGALGAGITHPGRPASRPGLRRGPDPLGVPVRRAALRLRGLQGPGRRGFRSRHDPGRLARQPDPGLWPAGRAVRPGSRRHLSRQRRLPADQRRGRGRHDHQHQLLARARRGRRGPQHAVLQAVEERRQRGARAPGPTGRPVRTARGCRSSWPAIPPAIRSTSTKTAPTSNWTKPTCSTSTSRPASTSTKAARA
jgi:hypothetical protein